MVFSKATFASAFVSLLACAAAVEVPKTDYEVIVVGGGPAGLSALSGVSRVRRTALLLDSQEYRNGVTREMHDVIGNDGEIGSQLYPDVQRFSSNILHPRQAPLPLPSEG
jgi:threonine dehydrogenase-like Zn-dependent dehydrogenase